MDIKNFTFYAARVDLNVITSARRQKFVGSKRLKPMLKARSRPASTMAPDRAGGLCNSSIGFNRLPLNNSQRIYADLH